MFVMQLLLWMFVSVSLRVFVNRVSFAFLVHSKLNKLSEDSLTKQPEEVFDVLEKLGEG